MWGSKGVTDVITITSLPSFFLSLLSLSLFTYSHRKKSTLLQHDYTSINSAEYIDRMQLHINKQYAFNIGRGREYLTLHYKSITSAKAFECDLAT